MPERNFAVLYVSIYYGPNTLLYKNSSGDEIANVNFFYDEFAHVGGPYFKIPKKKTYMYFV